MGLLCSLSASKDGALSAPEATKLGGFNDTEAKNCATLSKKRASAISIQIRQQAWLPHANCDHLFGFPHNHPFVLKIEWAESHGQGVSSRPIETLHEGFLEP